MKRVIKLAIGVAVLALAQGCATNITKPAGVPAPTTVRLATFANVEMDPVSINPAFASSGANQKAAKKINELLHAQMAYVFPELNRMEKASGSTLVIRPVIKELKFIGGAARFWVGAMAGSSAVLMEVTYLDKDSGSVIGQAEFYNQASAFVGGYSVGATDNLMLNNVVRQIISYTNENR